MNITPYLGIPYVPGGKTLAGCDCMGLVSLVYEQELGVVIEGEFSPLISEDWVVVDYPKPYDVVVLRLYNQPIHCGIVLEKCKMLHAREGSGVVVERYDSVRWQSRIERFVRHKARCYAG